MPAQVVDHYETVLAYLRSKYWVPASESWNVPYLTAARDSAFAAGTRTITLTSSSSEAGGSATGEITFDRLTLVAALNDLLVEAAPASQPPSRGRGHQVDFSGRTSAT